MREIGLLLEEVAACSEEEMLPFLLARLEWKREERRKRKGSKAIALLFKVKAIVLLERERRGGQRTHEVWKEESLNEKAVYRKGLRGITEASGTITKVLIHFKALKPQPNSFYKRKQLLKC